MDIKGVVLSLISCQPGQEPEFNAWYEQDYLPATRTVAGVLHTHRYVAPPEYLAVRRRVDEMVLADRGGQHMTVHYTADDPMACKDAMAQRAGALPEGKRAFPGAAFLLIRPFTFEGLWLRKGARVDAGAIPTGAHEGVFLTLSKVVDPGRTEELRRWYRGKHIPELLETRGFLATFRFLGLGPGDEDTFLHLHYLDVNPLAAMADLYARGPRWQEEERSLGVDSMRRPIINAVYRTMAAPPVQPP